MSAECHTLDLYAESFYAECHYAECHYGYCWGAEFKAVSSSRKVRETSNYSR